MQFNSIDYIILLLTAFTVFWNLKDKGMARIVFLLVVSYVFYMSWRPQLIVLIMFSTTVDFFCGMGIHRKKNVSSKRLLLVISLFSNLGLLFVFKYFNFFMDSLETVSTHTGLFSSPIPRYDIILPIGISFYTFQSLSYVIDIYRGRLKPVSSKGKSGLSRGLKSFAKYALFVSFFPQLVAGPIVRASDFLPQLVKPRQRDTERFYRGIFLLMCGLFKKIVLADFLATNIIDRVFELPEMYSSMETLFAIYGYALQIYNDFSGYSDIAIGSALLLGFQLPLNFRAPYVSASIKEFWQRWHISLSSWLKDYLYIPIGGNRQLSIFSKVFIMILLAGGSLFVILPSLKYQASLPFFISALLIYLAVAIFLAVSILRNRGGRIVPIYPNLLITMLIGGLWHGPAWKFVTWGVLHGAALALHRFFQSKVRLKFTSKLADGLWKVGSVMITFHFVCFCWVFFRADDFERAGKVLNNLTDFSMAGKNMNNAMILVLILGFGIHFLPEKLKKLTEEYFIRTPMYVKVLVLTVLSLILFNFFSTQQVPFIYFQF